MADTTANSHANSNATGRAARAGAPRNTTRTAKGDDTMHNATLDRAAPDQRAGQRPLINITGEKVGLGPMHRDLLPTVLRWDNDFGVSIFSGHWLRPRIKEQNDAEYDRWSKEESQRWVNFMIYELATMRLVGEAGLRDLDPTHQTAEYGIRIGEKDCWGKGFGTETTILMLDYAFSVLGLHSVLLRTSGYNERAIRAYRRAGFREIGRWREAQRWGGRRFDEVYMDCLATEFTSPLRPVLELP